MNTSVYLGCSSSKYRAEQGDLVRYSKGVWEEMGWLLQPLGQRFGRLPPPCRPMTCRAYSWLWHPSWCCLCLPSMLGQKSAILVFCRTFSPIGNIVLWFPSFYCLFWVASRWIEPGRVEGSRVEICVGVVRSLAFRTMEVHYPQGKLLS